MTAHPESWATDPALRLFLLLAVAIAFACLPGAVRADEDRYSLGTVQAVTELDVVSGEVVTTWLGFYNIDGSVPTTLDLVVASCPDGWRVLLSRDEASPGAQRIALAVEPSSPASEPQDCPAGSGRSVWLSGRGYVCAEVAWLQIEAPAAGPGKADGLVVVHAVATWPAYGAFQQERDIGFHVRLVESVERPRSSLATLLSASALMVLTALLLGQRIAKSHFLY